MAATLAPAVNNDIYATLGERWYSADDNPVALLRAEARHRNPWVSGRLRERCGLGARVLDVGCGAGFLSNHLAQKKFAVSAIDASPDAVEVARRHDETKSVQYRNADAHALPFTDGSFDAVCAMDFLEHVEDPRGIIKECSRVLRPGGLFFFHTFNRNPIAWLVVIKGVEWFVKNTPPNLHVLRLFIRPDELERFCREHELEFAELRGSKPVVLTRAFWRLLTTRVVPPDFRFEFTGSTLLGYTGFAVRRPA
jgi:2-polyprenyl-6-hydroxyphenyl methylase/3-demethylubiquinone-9 3-methyltransferase